MMKKSNSFIDKNNKEEAELRQPEDIIKKRIELREIIDAHQEWLKERSKEKRADLREATLYSAELREATLKEGTLIATHSIRANLMDTPLDSKVSHKINKEED